ncbi:MAG: M1 family metallopeptidase [Chitinophagales bacterium]|jgi:aminopeptidase N|nr:M1 family metallopeptidase [Chitinophagales bacterium]
MTTNHIKYRKNAICAIVALACWALMMPTQAQTDCYISDTAGEVREKNYLLQDLDLSLHFEEKKGKVHGKATYKLSMQHLNVDSIFLDAIEFEIHKLSIDGKEVKFRLDSAGITIWPKLKDLKSHDLLINYSCKPKKGIYFLNWNNNNPKAKKQIWTQGQGIDNRHWIPGFDDVANLLLTKLHIEFDEQYPVISNGNLIKVTLNPKKKTKIWTYQMTKPHALYLVMIAIGNYQKIIQKSKSGISIEQYYYPEMKPHLKAIYPDGGKMMDWFESYIGVKYPWGKVYRNVPVQDFLFGAMENTTSTIYTDIYHQDTRASMERGYLPTDAHELAHQWFGDLITERNPTHHWLHESFATHYSKHFLKFYQGQAAYHRIKLGELNGTMNAAKYNSLPIAHSKSGSARHYPKGSFVLDMLHDELDAPYYNEENLGEKNFQKAINFYLNKHKHQNVESNDLYECIYDATGIKTKDFFDQWIYRGEELGLSYRYEEESDKLRVIVTQHLKDSSVPAFQLYLEMAAISYEGKKSAPIGLHKVRLKKLSDTFFIPKPQRLSDNAKFALFLDPNFKVLKKMHYPDTLGAMSLLSVNIASTYEMPKVELLKALRKLPWETKNQAYQNLIHQSKSDLVWEEIAYQAQGKSDDIAHDIMIHAFQHSNHLVRREAIKGGNIANEEIKKLMEKALEDSSYLNIELAANRLIETDKAYIDLVLKKINGLQGYNQNLALLEIVARIIQSPSLLLYDSLVEFASENYEFQTRISSYETIRELKMPSNYPRLMDVTIDGLMHFNSRIQNSAKSLMLSLSQNEAHLWRQKIETSVSDTKVKARLLEILEKK